MIPNLTLKKILRAAHRLHLLCVVLRINGLFLYIAVTELVFIISEAECVHCAVQTEYLNMI